MVLLGEASNAAVIASPLHVFPWASSLTCLFSFSTLKRSKSVRLRRFSLTARLFAHALSSHFCSTSSFSQALATAPRPAARGNLGMTMCVRMTLPRAVAWRGTAMLGVFEGPSTRAWWCIRSANTLLRSYTYALVVDDLNDSCQAVDEFTVGEEHNAADLDQPPLRGADLHFCHRGGKPCRVSCQQCQIFDLEGRMTHRLQWYVMKVRRYGPKKLGFMTSATLFVGSLSPSLVNMGYLRRTATNMPGNLQEIFSFRIVIELIDA